MQLSQHIHDEPRPDPVRGIRHSVLHNVDGLAQPCGTLSPPGDCLRIGLAVGIVHSSVPLRNMLGNKQPGEESVWLPKIEGT